MTDAIRATGDSEAIRRDFAAGWAKVGAGWGIAPSTAAVQGYLLLHGGPLTETEIRGALGLSHKAAFGALAECEAWGLIEAAPPQHTGRRGPASRAWVVVGDHWEWFRRVAASRLARETEPVVPLVDACLERARASGTPDPALTTRLAALARFAHEFDRSMGAVVDADAAAIGRLAGVLARLDDETVARLLASLAEVPEDELVAAAGRVAGMRPAVLRRLLRLAAQPGVARLLDRLG
jgi:DNA-binding transcriptional regulator GbsR (MarR family)